MTGVHIIEVPAYIGAQMVGAITSSYALRLILASSVASEGATLPTGSDAQSLALEIIITFILMFVVSAVATDTRAVSSNITRMLTLDPIPHLYTKFKNL
jgi:glycerol uptake facilitator-like aquaporin